MIICINFMGYDFCADVDYRVSYRGHKAPAYGPPKQDFPPDSVEWDIERIVISRDIPLTEEQHQLVNRGHHFTPPFEATGAFFDYLAANERINDAICEEINEYGFPEPRDHE